MTIGMLGSSLFGDMFGTAAMRAVFGELAFLARCAEVEAALARAQARLGIVPSDAAEAIFAPATAGPPHPEMLDLAPPNPATQPVAHPLPPSVPPLSHPPPP